MPVHPLLLVPASVHGPALPVIPADTAAALASRPAPLIGPTPVSPSDPPPLLRERGMSVVPVAPDAPPAGSPPPPSPRVEPAVVPMVVDPPPAPPLSPVDAPAPAPAEGPFVPAAAPPPPADQPLFLPSPSPSPPTPPPASTSGGSRSTPADDPPRPVTRSSSGGSTGLKIRIPARAPSIPSPTRAPPPFVTLPDGSRVFTPRGRPPPTVQPPAPSASTDPAVPQLGALRRRDFTPPPLVPEGGKQRSRRGHFVYEAMNRCELCRSVSPQVRCRVDGDPRHACVYCTIRHRTCSLATAGKSPSSLLPRLADSPFT